MRETTTKQDAVELVEKYEKYLYNKFTTDQEWVECVESALIGIRQVKYLLENSVREPIEYLEDLEKEIDKL
jgi:hypothetical protein